MKYGVFSVCLPEYDVAESVELLQELGYQGVEWRVAEMPKEKPEDIPFEKRYWIYNKSTLELGNIQQEAQKAKQLCDKAGLEIFGLTTYLAVGEKDKLLPVFQAAKSIGCHQVRAGLVPYDPQKAEKKYPQLFEELRQSLKELEPLLKEYRIKLVLEIHMDTLISSPSAACRALEGLNPKHYGLIFDPGNMVNEGFEEYQKSFEMLGEYIAHIHIKNGVLEQDGRDELGACKWKRKWTPLKEGMADLKKLFEVMKQAGYDGTVSVEDFSNDSETKEKLIYDRNYLKELEAVTKQQP